MTSQGFATIRVRRAAFGVVPWGGAAIAEFLVTAAPSPEFHQRMHPQIEMIDSHVGPDVPHLLLACAPDFLDVVEVLLDRGSIGERFHNLHHAHLRSRREERKPK